uniref:TPT domain-containing protein n=1 Tax=Steinernema glaseri TaxID=37863 RepID=A0A1I7ZAB5_9BILA
MDLSYSLVVYEEGNRFQRHGRAQRSNPIDQHYFFVCINIILIVYFGIRDADYCGCYFKIRSPEMGKFGTACHYLYSLAAFLLRAGLKAASSVALLASLGIGVYVIGQKTGKAINGNEKGESKSLT